MKKVLIISTVGFGHGGMTNTIMNYMCNMDKTDIRIYFLVFRDNIESISQKLRKIGDVVIVSSRKNVLRYATELNKTLKQGFDVVHIHGNSGTMALETSICKFNHVKRIIIHGHSQNTNHPLINGMLKPIAFDQADVLVSCSEAAGKWLYGNREFVVLNNAIDVNRFAFNTSVREEVRKELGIDNEQVIGHVGYFDRVKNHTFLVDVFSCYHKICQNSKLLLVGDGNLKNEIKSKVKGLGLEDDVIFLEPRIDIERIYQAMDIFIFPSLSEGLGLVAIEAQMAGLPVLASEAIPKVVACTPIYQTKMLDEGAQEWANVIQQIFGSSYERRENNNEIRQLLFYNGFDINSNVSRLYDIYVE